jgi:hypothetical protein
MILKTTYNSQSEIPQGFEALYTEKDGKFVLTGVEGIKTQEDVDNVKQALTRERELKRELEKKVAAYDGIEADGLRDQLDELARLRTTGGKVDDAKIEDIVKERLKLDREKHARDLEKVLNENKSLKETNTSLVNEKNTTLIEKQLREAAAGKVNETAMNDVLFRASIFEVSESGDVVTRDGVGVTPGQAPQEWLDETLKTNSHWQTVSSGAGARGNTGGNTTTPKQGRMSVKDIVAESVQFN